jgi:hypothetical protein
MGIDVYNTIGPNHVTNVPMYKLRGWTNIQVMTADGHHTLYGHALPTSIFMLIWALKLFYITFLHNIPCL